MELSLVEAGRLALTAQGFGRRPAKPGLGHVRAVSQKVLATQLDSVNVLVRSHYLPAYSRLGPYPRQALDTLAYRRHEIFEAWSHASCLLPNDLYPLLRHRMLAMRGRPTWSLDASVEGSDIAQSVLAEITDRGALAVAELSDHTGPTGKWWGWSKAKQAAEALLETGYLAVAGRRGFTRIYDLAERVIPAEFLQSPAPGPDTAQKELLVRSVAALGVATARGLGDYLGLHSFRIRIRHQDGKPTRAIWPRLLTELVEEGRIAEVTVEGWPKPGYVLPNLRIPRTFHARALLSPFDSFIRVSAGPCCGFSNPLAKQLYVPAERRIFGYYVLPFLLGDTLVGRVDLKADREHGRLLVQAAHLEPGRDGREVAAALAEELDLLRDWLELDSIKVAASGDLAEPLRHAGRFGTPVQSTP